MLTLKRTHLNAVGWRHGAYTCVLRNTPTIRPGNTNGNQQFCWLHLKLQWSSQNPYKPASLMVCGTLNHETCPRSRSRLYDGHAFCEQHSMMGSAACYAHSIALAVRQFASKNIEVLQNTSKHYVCTKKCRVDSDIVWAFFSSRPPLKNVLHLSTWNWCHSFMKIFIPRPQTQWPCSFWDVNRRTWANWTCTLEIFPLPSPHSVRP